MRLVKAWGWMGLVVLILLLVAGLPLTAQSKAPDKCDALLKAALSGNDNAQKLSRAVGLVTKAGKVQEIEVLVLLKGDSSQLRNYLSSVGGRIGSQHGDIYSARLPLAKVPGLASLPSVLRVEASVRLQSTNDIAAGETGVNTASILDANPKYTGKGVVVGIIDTGVDTTLPAFQTSSGTSRIAYYWDQADDSDAARQPTVVTPEGESRTYLYGAEYTGRDIDLGEYGNLDGDYHGTHVAGTIGGRDAVFPGIAPEVQYIVVANNSDNLGDMWTGAGTGATLDAYEYIVSRAKEMGLPLVINQSQATDMGPHDGSTLFEQAIQADIESAQRNMILCVSAGNSQADKKAAKIEIPAGGTVEQAAFMLDFGEDMDVVLYNSIDIWSLNNPELDLEVVKYTDETCTAVEGQALIPYGGEGEYPITASVKAIVSSEIPSTLNGDDRVLLTLRGLDESAWFGYYGLRFTNKSSQAASVNMYIQRNTTLLGLLNSEFINGNTPGTIGMPGTTPGAITVGAYNSRVEYVDAGGNVESPYPGEVGDVAMFSSCGPVRNAARYLGYNTIKPDISAPGNVLISQLATGCEVPDSMKSSDGRYLALSGTSMSAPVVTGLVALMLQQMPNAKASDIKAALFDKARLDEVTGSEPGPIFGHGRADAQAVDSKSLVPACPVITNAYRVRDSVDNLAVIGGNFALDCQAYVNGELWPAEDTEYVAANEVHINNIPAKVTVYEVAIVNLRGVTDHNRAEYQVRPRDDEGNLPVSKSSSGGGCFVATAAYGSYMDSEVMNLRRFRDRSLLTNAPGRMFVDLYYTYSPPVADFISRHESARFAARMALTPVVYSVTYPTQALAGMGLLVLTGGALAWRRRRQRLAA